MSGEPIDINERLAMAAEADETWSAEHLPPKEQERREKAIEAAQPPEEPPRNKPTADDHNNEPADLRNELADADCFVVDIIGKAWYCPQRAGLKRGDIESGWLVWDGKRLRPSEDGAIMRLAKDTVLRLSQYQLADAAEFTREITEEQAKDEPDKGKLKGLYARRARAYAKADQLQSENRMMKIVSLARMDERIIIDADELDADPDILNVQNGVVHLPTGELKPHHPDFRCTRITAVPYRQDADRAALERVVNRMCMRKNNDGRWVTDHDRVRYLQDAIGAGLYGHQRLQRFYICIGNGGDGKGTIFESLLDALGGGHDGYAMKADMQSFIKQKLAGHKIRDDLANMADARLVLASEINKGDALDGALVKTLTGEDVQRVRHLFGKEFEFRPICTLFMQANHEPYVDSQDNAIWRRLVKIPCGPSIPDDERDPSVRADLMNPETGGAGLLAWAIEGAVRTANVQRIPSCDSIDQATAAYRGEMNPLAGFLVDDIRIAPLEKAKQTWVEQKAIRPAYEQWVAEAGLDDKRGPSVSGKRIGQQLRDCGAWPGSKKIDNKACKVWFGITLRYDHELNDKHCKGSFCPTDETHHARLAETGAVEVTWLPHADSAPPAGAREIPHTYARGIDSSRDTSGSRERGNQVTNEEPGGFNYPDQIPDLDNLDEPPF